MKIELTRKQLQDFLESAAFMAERAYRRGFQHGINYANRGITDEDAVKFRFHVSYNKAWGAPEKDNTGKIRNPWRGINHSLTERHIEMESRSSVLKHLLYKAGM